MSRPLPIMAVQAAPVAWDVEATWQKFQSDLRELKAMVPQTRLFLWPELYLAALGPMSSKARAGYSMSSIAEPVPGWSSVRSTVYHIALVTEIHLRTLAGDPDDSIPTEADLATVDDAARLLERAYRRFEELQPTLTPERLNTVVTLRRRGRTATLPPWAMLRHIVNHSTYHRGQVASKLKRFGVEQPLTDFFFWVIEQIPQEK